MLIMNNYKEKKLPLMTIIKIAIVVFLFIIITDKGIFNNMLNNINRVNSSTFDIMTENFFSLGKLTFIDYSFVSTLGFAMVCVAILVAITMTIYSIFVFHYSEDFVEKEMHYKDKDFELVSNDIYLQTNKLIC